MRCRFSVSWANPRTRYDLELKEADKREKKKKKISVCSSVVPMALYVGPPLLEGCASPGYRQQHLQLVCRQYACSTPPSLSVGIESEQKQRESLTKCPFLTCRIEQGLLLSTRHGAETLVEKAKKRRIRAMDRGCLQ